MGTGQLFLLHRVAEFGGKSGAFKILNRMKSHFHEFIDLSPQFLLKKPTQERCSRFYGFISGHRHGQSNAI